MIEIDFDKWNNIKKDTHKENVLVGFRNRDIFYIKMGQNIGFEQNGKGDNFVRPVIVFKKFNKNIVFWNTFVYTDKRGMILLLF